MASAGRLLQDSNDWISCICMAHRLQTVVRHALAIKDVAKLLTRSRKLVGHFKHSCLAAEALSTKQKQLKPEQQPLNVVQDASTRWNSTFYMLERLVKLRVSLTAVLCDEQITPKRDDRDMLLRDTEWSLAEHLIDLLGPFEIATTAVNAQRYVTMSLQLPIAAQLFMEVSASDARLPRAAKNVAKKLKTKMVRKFPEVASPPPTSTFTLASALGPRFRQLSFLDTEKSAAAQEVILDKLKAQQPATNVEPPAK